MSEESSDPQNPYAPPQSNVEDVQPLASAELASRGARLGGALIDSLLSAMLLFPMLFAFDIWEELTQSPEFPVELQVLAIGLGIYAVLNGVLLVKYGQTIGKRLVGTRIVDFDDQQILPFWKVFWVRYVPFTLVALIPGAGNVLPLVDVLFVFRADRRCLHDLLANTKVVKA